jgi:hypothetical protein
MCVWIVLNEKLTEKVVARCHLEKELGETKTTLLKESNEAGMKTTLSGWF